VTRAGAPGELYDAAQDRADGKAFLERSAGDRHQFRFIVSSDDGADYEDLKGFTRRLMAQMEEDLDTRLDWVAVDHYNTAHPHTHIILRGRDDQDRDLVIAPDYITHGLRERASEIVSFDLGPRSDLEIEDRLRREITQERLTGLDRGLLRDAGTDRILGPGLAAKDVFHQSLRAGRLQTLQRMGLAEEIKPGRWQLAEELELTLRRMGERGDIIKTMNRAMAGADMARVAGDYAIYDLGDATGTRLVGRVVTRGFSDEIKDRHYLLIDGTDGRTHYVEVGRADALDATPDGAIVAVSPRQAEPKAVDHRIAAVAAAHGGRYSIDIHLRSDRTATESFAETHVRRLEAMRRAGIGVEREKDGSWTITSDHLDRAADHERRLARASPVIVETLSRLPLDRQIGAQGVTWLDRELTSAEPTPLRDANFGRETRLALALRRQWLMEQGLAEQQGDQTIVWANMLAVLRRREVSRVANQLSEELGLRHTEPHAGEPVEGIYRRRVDLVSGPYALIENAREFTLVPWRPVLERNLGKEVSGIARGETFSWTLGGRRRGPSIS
jgi:type IV secretory pathway VirD2 relaxase